MVDTGVTPPGAVRFALLGSVRAWRGDELLELGTPQQQAMLAVLLLRHGRAATAEELVDAIWGADSPPRAVGALRTYASRLRRVLEGQDSPPRVLVSVGNGYAVRIDDDAVDVAAFHNRIRAAERARADGDLARAARLLHQALELWGGTPLTGLPGPFAEAQRDQLGECRLSALETRLELDLELGRHTEIVGELTAVSSEHPLREHLRGLLMLALYRCGRQAEALAVFADTRRILADELGIDPEPELQNLHQRILQADPLLAARETQPAETAERPPAVRPAQLPAGLADFTGRRGVVDELVKAVTGPDNSAVVVSAVAGIGGVGKTTVAVHVGHAVRDHFPDGQLYVDLRGIGDQPAEAGAVLAGFLRALGTADSALPESLEERAALYRTALADRQVLVLLDNARDSEQVRPLLPGSAGCAVLVTSRARLAGLPGARLVDLDVLDPREALALFTQIVGESRVAMERQAAMSVVARCGCLPLAVRIVASRLASRPSWSIASLADRLADERRRLTELRVGDLTVEASFRLGYDQLEPAYARSFRLLAVADGPDIALPAAAAVLELDEPEAEDVLESLVDAALLESPSPGRYRYHDLLRLFSRQQAEHTDTAADRSAALTRLLDFHLATVGNAHRVIRPGDPVSGVLAKTRSAGLSFADAEMAHAWTRRELTGVLAVIAQAAHDPAVPIAICADVILGLEPLVEAGFCWGEVEPAARAVADAARQRRDRRSEARALCQLVSALLEMYRLDQTDELARRAAELCRDTGDGVVLSEILNLRGFIAIRSEHQDEAIAFYNEAIALNRERGDRYNEAQMTRNSAFAFISQGRAVDAVPACERSLTIFRELGDARGEAHTLYMLGLAQHRAGRLAEAIVRYQDGLAVCRTNGLRSWESFTLFRLADAHLAVGHPTDAVTFAEQALAISLELNEEYNQGRTLSVLGRALADLRQTDRSQACLREALEIFTRLGVPEADDVRPMVAEPRERQAR